MANNHQPGAQDTKFYNKPKFDYKRFNEPCLPNGEKPDFGNGPRNKKKTNSTPNPNPNPNSNPNQYQPPSYQQYYNNHYYNNQQGQQGQQSQPQQAPNQNQQRRKQNKPKPPKESKSPLSSPQFVEKSPVINSSVNNYQLGPTGSTNATSNTKGKPITNFAGPTFHHSPETKSLPKPSFL